MRKVEKNGLGPSRKHAFRHRPSAQETRTASRLRRSRRNGAPSFRPDARRIVPGRGNGYAKHSVGSVRPARTRGRATGRSHEHSSHYLREMAVGEPCLRTLGPTCGTGTLYVCSGLGFRSGRSGGSAGHTVRQ